MSPAGFCYLFSSSAYGLRLVHVLLVLILRSSHADPRSPAKESVSPSASLPEHRFDTGDVPSPDSKSLPSNLKGSLDEVFSHPWKEAQIRHDYKVHTGDISTPAVTLEQLKQFQVERQKEMYQTLNGLDSSDPSPDDMLQFSAPTDDDDTPPQQVESGDQYQRPEGTEYTSHGMKAVDDYHVTVPQIEDGYGAGAEAGTFQQQESAAAAAADASNFEALAERAPAPEYVQLETSL